VWWYAESYQLSSVAAAARGRGRGRGRVCGGLLMVLVMGWAVFGV